MTMLRKTNYEEYHSIRDTKVLAKLPDQLYAKSTNLSFKRARLKPLEAILRGRQPYEFSETYRILDSESFVASAFRKKKTIILKEGYNLISHLNEDVLYVKKRLEEMQYVTGNSFKEFLEDLVSSLINNHNAFVLLVRKKASSTGMVRKIGNKKLEPIAGFYVLPETKVNLLEDEFGQVVGYEYEITKGYVREFSTDEILHLKFDNKPGYNLGTPPLEPLIDDLLALRQIEESLERLIYKLSMPIIHAKVGTVDKPAGIDKLTGQKEVDQVNEALLYMEDAGGITTSERVEFKMLGAESQALRLSGYLEYFKNRLLVGFSMSDLDFGVANSTSAGSAQEVTKALKENVEMYQRKIEDFVTDKLITSILLEKEDYAENFYLEEDDKVLFRLVNDNIDEKIKIESHLINEANAYLITVDEYRLLTGKKPLTAKEKKELKEMREGPKDDSKVNPLTNTGTNQHTDKTISRASNESSGETPIRDSLNVYRYVENVYNSNSSVAAITLSKDICKELETNNIPFNSEDMHSFISSLTTTLQSFIIGKSTKDSTVSIVEKMICRKLEEVINENI